MRQRATGDLVFEGEREGSPISDTAMTKSLRLAAGDKTVTLHGLRSSFDIAPTIIDLLGAPPEPISGTSLLKARVRA